MCAVTEPKDWKDRRGISRLVVSLEGDGMTRKGVGKVSTWVVYQTPCLLMEWALEGFDLGLWSILKRTCVCKLRPVCLKFC